MSRTKDPNRENKDFTIRVRVTMDEREEILQKAMAKGYRSISEYIRTLIKEDTYQNEKLES